MKMRAVGISVISLTLTAAVISNAYYQKKQFYPSVVYITKTNASMAVIYVQAFILVMLMGKLMRKVFFGQLRAAEFEHLMERSWYAVTETCLAFTVFRDDFNPKFVALFTVLLFLKSFHWLAEDRVDYMERSPVISWLFHIRVLGLLTLLGVLDVYFLSTAYYSTVTKGASVQLVFGFEYAILLTMVANTAIKYCLHAADLRSESPWDGKAVLLLYSELVVGFIRVLLYLAFVAIMVRIYTLPLFAFRPMYYTMRNFKKAFNDVILSRRAIRNMNTLYPDATSQELTEADNVCIICREEMTNNAKKLPCNHIFHTACLRSWFQRQQTCPTCRLDILRPPTNANGQTTPQAQPEAGRVAGNQAGAAAQARREQMAHQPQRNQTDTAAVPPIPNAMPGPFHLPPGFPNIPGLNNLPGNASGASPSVGSFPLPPFGTLFTPPPPPPRDLASLTDEELRAMEGHERNNVEARIKYIREIQLLLDTSIALMQNYHMITARLPPFASPETKVDTETASDNVEIPAATTENKTNNAEPGPSTSKDITPNTSSATNVGNTLANAVSSGVNDELRRRRLRRFENNE